MRYGPPLLVLTFTDNPPLLGPSPPPPRKKVPSLKENSRVACDFISSTGILKLLDESSNLCEGQLTLSECYAALKEFENNKSPGSDGLTTEFYKGFWPVVGRQLVETLNFSHAHGELSTSQKQATTTLIEKTDRDKKIIF